TGIELHRRQNRARETVQIISDQHGTAVVVAHVFGEVEFLRFIVCLDLDKAATGAVIRRDENAVPTCNRCGHVRYVIRRLSVFPQQSAVVYIETQSAIVSKENDLS